MLLKQHNLSTTLNLFDVADASKREVNLAKLTAYLISSNLNAFTGLLDAINIRFTSEGYNEVWRKSKIQIEKSYTTLNEGGGHLSGRTDIEIDFSHNGQAYHIIIECKINDGRATSEQFYKYKSIFDIENYENCYFVFLSHQSGVNLIDASANLTVIDLTWRELVNSLSDRCTKMQSDLELSEFLAYYERSYGTTNQREVLVQDLSDPVEMLRSKNCVYRRDKVSGSPLYFAPYITNAAASRENTHAGISQISKVLGIITAKRKFLSWLYIKSTCEKFLARSEFNDTNALRDMWEFAVEIKDDPDPTEEFTYYFLDKPVIIEPPLVKDTRQSRSISEGSERRDNTWIGRQIPKNRNISFAEFLTRMR